MKIGGCVIQNRNILTNTPDEFWGKYKGKSIFITTDHGLGRARYDHLKRFSIQVIDDNNNGTDVDTYEDLHTIRDAILYALKGAMLTP